MNQHNSTFRYIVKGPLTFTFNTNILLKLANALIDVFESIGRVVLKFLGKMQHDLSVVF